jgi:hypothetical protein
MNQKKWRFFDHHEVAVLRDDCEVVCVICATCVRGG